MHGFHIGLWVEGRGREVSGGVNGGGGVVSGGWLTPLHKLKILVYTGTAPMGMVFAFLLVFLTCKEACQYQSCFRCKSGGFP